MFNFVELPEDVLAAQRALNEQIAALALPSPRDADGLDKMRLISGGRSAETQLLAEELTIPGPAGELELRVFRPLGEIRGVAYNIHGGGFALGSRRNDDAANDRTAREAGIATVAVEYRRSPEDPFPAGLDDCVAGAIWLAENSLAEFGTERLVMAGGSAGAYYAVQTLLRLRAERPELFAKYQAASLIFGVYDLGRTPSSRAATDESLVLTDSWMTEFIDIFMPGVPDRQIAELSPLYADLSGMPPALFTVGTLDPQLDDSMFMAARWQAAGGAAELDIWPEAPHAFTSMTPPTGLPAQARINSWLSGVLG